MPTVWLTDAFGLAGGSRSGGVCAASGAATAIATARRKAADVRRMGASSSSVPPGHGVRDSGFAHVRHGLLVVRGGSGPGSRGFSAARVSEGRSGTSAGSSSPPGWRCRDPRSRTGTPRVGPADAHREPFGQLLVRHRSREGLPFVCPEDRPPGLRTGDLQFAPFPENWPRRAGERSEYRPHGSAAAVTASPPSQSRPQGRDPLRPCSPAPPHASQLGGVGGTRVAASGAGDGCGVRGG